MSDLSPADQAFRKGERGLGRGMPWNDCAPSRVNNLQNGVGFLCGLRSGGSVWVLDADTGCDVSG